MTDGRADHYKRLEDIPIYARDCLTAAARLVSQLLQALN